MSRALDQRRIKLAGTIALLKVAIENMHEIRDGAHPGNDSDDLKDLLDHAAADTYSAIDVLRSISRCPLKSPTTP